MYSPCLSMAMATMATDSGLGHYTIQHPFARVCQLEEAIVAIGVSTVPSRLEGFSHREQTYRAREKWPYLDEDEARGRPKAQIPRSPEQADRSDMEVLSVNALANT